MDGVLLVGRLLLAAVFLTAGITKLTDLAGSRQAIRDFGLPGALAGPTGTVLPLLELAVAVALLFTASAWWGALGALVLLAAFLVGIGVNLAQGRRPDCHCFGQLHSEPIGPSTVIRNLILAAIGIVLLVQGPSHVGASAFAWMTHLSAAEVAGTVVAIVVAAAIFLLGWLLLNTMQQNGRLLTRLQRIEKALEERGLLTDETETVGSGLPVGAPAPGFALPDLAGRTVTSDALLEAGRSLLLIFTDAKCTACARLLPYVATWQREHADLFRVVLVSSGSTEENAGKTAKHHIDTVLLQQDNTVSGAYMVKGTPTAVRIRPDGMIGSALAEGDDAIRSLVGSLARRESGQIIPLLDHAPASRAPQNGNGASAQAAPPAIGQPVPRFSVPDLDGTTVTSENLLGRKTVLLFWGTTCGYCRQIMPDLKAWEENPPASAADLLLVSRGTVEENRAIGLRARVVLDGAGTIMQAIGARGTPTAVLIDADGRIASNLEVGGPNVLALLGTRAAQPV